MMKFVTLAAATAVALTAMPAAAADVRVSPEPAPVVRINVIGKTDAQVASEIKAAAQTVCEGERRGCVMTATLNANRQYAAIKRVRDGATGTRVEVVREDRAIVRVKVTGRSLDQINADIETAAKAVCAAVGGPNDRACIEKASRNAKSQLRDMQVATTDQFAAR